MAWNDKKVYFTGAFPGHPHRGHVERLAKELKAAGYAEQHWARPVTRADDGMEEIVQEDREALLSANLAVIFQGSPRADCEQILAAEHNVPHVVIYPPNFPDQDPFIYHTVTRREGPRRWGWEVGTLDFAVIMESIREIFSR